MRYADNTATNEQRKLENGERELVTSEMLTAWLAGESTNANAWELLLDILNGQVPVEDIVEQVTESWDEDDE